MHPAIDLLRRGERRLELAIDVYEPMPVAMEERIDEDRRTNSLIVSGGSSGDGDDRL